MTQTEATCWTLVQDAASGDEDARGTFARVYLPVVRAYLAARWRNGYYRGDLDDAIQDTFLDCFRDAGALSRADRGHPGRFRTFLYAVVRNIALRYEQKRARDWGRRAPVDQMIDDLPAAHDQPSRAFDRAWARALLKRATQRQEREARAKGAGALRRVEILRLRFSDNLPIRAIARQWNEDPADVHREYAKARAEFKRCLLAEVACHHAGSAQEVERECVRLLDLLK